MPDVAVSRIRCVAAAVCGLAAAALALWIPIVAAWAEPTYSHVSQFISELGAQGALQPTFVAAAGFAPIGALVLAFLAFAHGAFPRARRVKVGVACLCAVGAAYLVSAVFPCDAGCPASGSRSQSVHSFFGFLEYAGAVPGLLLLASAFRTSPDWRRLAAPSILAAAGVAAGFLAMLTPGFAPVRGLSQRIAEASIFGWIAGVSLVLLRNARPRYAIGPAREGDLETLPQIERAAAARFGPGQLPAAVRDETTSLDELHAARAAGLLWVARVPGGDVVGFALVELLEGMPHLEEVDVDPAHGRRGVGRALVEAVLDWAHANGHASVSLTSFRDVPWNAPFYASLGFRVVEPHELTPSLEAVVADETARGLEPSRRVVMRKELPSAP